MVKSDMSVIEDLLRRGFVPVLHGDCVRDRNKGFNILSGDVIVEVSVVVVVVVVCIGVIILSCCANNIHICVVVIVCIGVILCCCVNNKHMCCCCCVYWCYCSMLLCRYICVQCAHMYKFLRF